MRIGALACARLMPRPLLLSVLIAIARTFDDHKNYQIPRFPCMICALFNSIPRLSKRGACQTRGVTMLTRTLLILCALFAMLLIGCSKTETTTNDNSASSSKASRSPATTTVSAGEKIGVPECDDFIAKYDACVSSKVPEAARVQ